MVLLREREWWSVKGLGTGEMGDWPEPASTGGLGGKFWLLKRVLKLVVGWELDVGRLSWP